MAGQPKAVAITRAFDGLEGADLKPNALILPAQMSYERWERCGEILRGIERAAPWWIGDWLNYGERKYGEKYSQALTATDYDAGTLRDAAWVASRFELSRRRDNLSWSHHREVAPLEPKDQDKWLERAETLGWSRNRLRGELEKKKRLLAKTTVPNDLPEVSERYQLIHADLANVNGEVATKSVDWIVTDPPYPQEFLPVYEVLSEFASRVLKPGGSALVMVGQSYLPDVIANLGKHLHYHWTLSYLTPGGQAVQLWDRKVNTFWKPVLWFVKGEYTGDWIGDVCKSAVNDNDKEHHHWGQSESGMADLMERFTFPGQVVCDPFLGGGTTAVVALKMNRRFIGIDVDREAIETTKGRIAALA